MKQDINQAKSDQRVDKTLLLKHIENIEAIAVPVDRYRAIKKFLLEINPKIKAYDDAFIEGIKVERANQLKDTGASKDNHMRSLLDLPTYIYEAIILADNEFNHAVNLSHDIELEKKAWRDVAKAFPEYRIAKVV
jgi:hypothetical protein